MEDVLEQIVGEIWDETDVVEPEEVISVSDGVYNIDGDMDYQTNIELACEYFSKVNAPEKELLVMKYATHGLLESRSGEFSTLLHKIQ